MRKIQILDCTLRDGGYCNDWNFGRDNIARIINALVDADIDIIECGYVSKKAQKNNDSSKFSSLADLEKFLPEKRTRQKFVCMINYGEYPADEVSHRTEHSVDGIRVAFHKREAAGAIAYAAELMEKGYDVFLQPMVSLSYTEAEFFDLVRAANEIMPYAFYIVDSFGGMKEQDMLRLFYILEHSLADGIWIGFHSHNNMQLAYANAKSLLDLKTQRDLIIDSSIFGMGRGAGNLNTELLTEHLNETEGTKYDLEPIISVIDHVLDGFYQKNYWGYSVPNYLSARHEVHPSYANYLVDRQTLLIEDMNRIFAQMDAEKKAEFDRDYIEQLYYRYMEQGKAMEDHLNDFKDAVTTRRLLIIAPGRSVETQKEQVLSFAQETSTMTICVNFDYPYLDADYIFTSNLRRYDELDIAMHGKCIVTSNIPSGDCYMTLKYADLLNEIDAVRDNAGLMLLQFLSNCGVREVTVAGMDGYSHDLSDNYALDSMAFWTQNAILDARNAGMKIVLARLGEKIHINFLTESRFAQ